MSYLREDPEIEEVLSIERTGSGQFNVDVTRQLIQHEIEELTSQPSANYYMFHEHRIKCNKNKSELNVLVKHSEDL